jgi:hypothetical protein
MAGKSALVVTFRIPHSAIPIRFQGGVSVSLGERPSRGPHGYHLVLLVIAAMKNPEEPD